MDRSQSSSACRSCGRGATSAGHVPGSAAARLSAVEPAGGAWRSYTSAATRYSRAVTAAAWPIGANRRSRAIAPSSERSGSKCGWAAVPISPNRSPERPRGMHRLTYYRLLGKAMAAQERSIALMADWSRPRVNALAPSGSLGPSMRSPGPIPTLGTPPSNRRAGGVLLSDLPTNS
jgi:hypothetical protein